VFDQDLATYRDLPLEERQHIDKQLVGRGRSTENDRFFAALVQESVDRAASFTECVAMYNDMQQRDKTAITLAMDGVPQGPVYAGRFCSEVHRVISGVSTAPGGSPLDDLLSACPDANRAAVRDAYNGLVHANPARGRRGHKTMGVMVREAIDRAGNGDCILSVVSTPAVVHDRPAARRPAQVTLSERAAATLAGQYAAACSGPTIEPRIVTLLAHDLKANSRLRGSHRLDDSIIVQRWAESQSLTGYCPTTSPSSARQPAQYAAPPTVVQANDALRFVGNATGAKLDGAGVNTYIDPAKAAQAQDLHEEHSALQEALVTARRAASAGEDGAREEVQHVQEQIQSVETQARDLGHSIVQDLTSHGVNVNTTVVIPTWVKVAGGVAGAAILLLLVKSVGGGGGGGNYDRGDRNDRQERGRDYEQR